MLAKGKLQIALVIGAVLAVCARSNGAVVAPGEMLWFQTGEESLTESAMRSSLDSCFVRTLSASKSQTSGYLDGAWSSLGSGITGQDVFVHAVTNYDGLLIVGGSFSMAGGTPANNIASWDGCNWAPLGSGTNGSISAMTVFESILIVAGSFTTAGSTSAKCVAAWDGSTWTALGSGFTGSLWSNVSTGVASLCVHENQLIAGGNFTSAGGNAAKCIASWNGADWFPLSSGMNQSVASLASLNGVLYAGGGFTTSGGTSTSYIARWDGSTWSGVGSGTNNWVLVLRPYEGELIAGGWFGYAGGNYVGGIAQWDGVNWSGVGGGMDHFNVRSIAEFDGCLVAGGWFTYAGSTPANSIALWNGTTWSPLGSGMTGSSAPWVFSLVSYGGQLIAAGMFDHAGGVDANNIAAWSEPPDPLTDSDGDALPDTWETMGYDSDGDGIVDVDLPAMGADAARKDIYVEIDWMGQNPAHTHDHKPKRAAIDRIVSAFAAAPVNNPNGSTGITLHVDYGQGGVWNGGNEIPHDDDLSPVWTEFDNIKAVNFNSARERVFHYCIFAHNYDNSGSSGLSRNGSDAASDFIVALGGATGDCGTEEQQAGTFMHELGHNLGLKHAGDGDDPNFKPNYLSVMNYFFQNNGLRRSSKWGNFDYSRHSLPTLDENCLDETEGLNGPSQTNEYGTEYFCANSDPRQGKTVDHINEAIDWDCDGLSTNPCVSGSVTDEGDITVLNGFEDWSRLIYDGGLIGSNQPRKEGSIDPDSTSYLRELTWEEYEEFCIRRGDADNSGTIDIADAVYIVQYIFAGGIAPANVADGDPDASENIDIADAVRLVNYIFSNGPKPSCY